MTSTYTFQTEKWRWTAGKTTLKPQLQEAGMRVEREKGKDEEKWEETGPERKTRDLL